MSKFTYGERKAFGRGVKCGFAKGLRSKKKKPRSLKPRKKSHTTNTRNYASTSRDDCWYL